MEKETEGKSGHSLCPNHVLWNQASNSANILTKPPLNHFTIPPLKIKGLIARQFFIIQKGLTSNDRHLYIFMTFNDYLHNFDGNNHICRSIHREIKVLYGYICFVHIHP